jgi:hypothetical protein
MTTEIKFEEHQTLEQVQKNFQSSYIENDIVFWESNDQMPFEEMTTNFFLAGFITKEQKEKTDYARETMMICFGINILTKERRQIMLEETVQ